MKQKIRVIQYGVGAMGSNMVKLMLTKPDVQIVGAIDHDPKKIGRDLGDVVGAGKKLGIKVQFPPEKVLNTVKADIVVLATTAFIDEAYPQIMSIFDRGMNVVTIVQELFFPVGDNVKKAEAINKKAKAKGLRISATGINPGFIMDILPSVCSFPLWEVHKVTVKRNVDFSPYGPDEMVHIGANLTPAEFIKGAKNETIGHIGLLETTAMVAYCTGIAIDELRQTKKPIIAKKPRKTSFVRIEPGKVCGFNQQVLGLKNGKVKLHFEMNGILDPNSAEDGFELGDSALVEGTPNVNVRVKEEISQRGGLGTAAAAVNMIPRVLDAAPGYHMMHELGMPTIWTGTRDSDTYCPAKLKIKK